MYSKLAQITELLNYDDIFGKSSFLLVIVAGRAGTKCHLCRSIFRRVSRLSKFVLGASAETWWRLEALEPSAAATDCV